MAAPGIVVHPRSTVEWDPVIVERFRRVAPASIGHFMEEGFMDPGIKPLGRKVKLVGPALTVYALSNRSVMGEAIAAAQPGDVIVVDRGGERKRSTFGEMLALRALRAGIAGIVIDGPTTDLIELQELGLPVFARGVSAFPGPVLATEGSINAPITCGGVVVYPGDLILGDDNGLVALRPDGIGAILERAEAREQDEAQKRAEAATWLRR
jgi:regulator of RNase E activity RraA